MKTITRIGSRSTYTHRELTTLTDAELSELQRSLGAYLGTAEEEAARLLNRAVNEERQRRGGWGW